MIFLVIPGNKLERESNEDPLLVKNLVSAIKRINNIDLAEEDIQEVLKQLRLRGVGVDDCKKILSFFKFGVSIKQKRFGYKHNNNCIERDHQYSKDRIKAIRHFKKFDSADKTLDFFDIHYNFIDGQKLKNEKRFRTPAQRAGLDINLPKRYQLLNLIRRCMGTED